MNFREEFLIDLFSHLPASLAWMDSNRIYRAVTPSYAQLLRRRPENLLGRSFYDFSPEMKDRLEPVLEQAASTGEAINVNDIRPFFTAQGADQDLFWKAEIWAIRDSKTRAGWMVFLTDLTQEMENQMRLENALAELEEQREKLRMDVQERERIMSLLDQSHLDLAAQHIELEQANQYKNHLLIDLSHEIRTPLNIILGYGQLLQDEKFGTITPAQRDVLQRMMAYGRSLSNMVDRLLDLSKTQRHTMPLLTTQVLLPELLESLFASIRPLLRERQIRLKWKDGTPDPKIVSDPIRLRRIFLNLISNLIKFIHHTTLTIRLRDLPEKKCVVVTFSGSGNRSGPLSDVFEDYFRVTAKHQGESVGLGMAVVKDLLEQIGGRIEIHRSARGTATFTVTLPYRPPQVRESTAGEQKAA